MKSFSSTGLFVFLFSLILSGTGLYLFTSKQKTSSNQGLPFGSIAHITGNPEIRNQGEPFWHRLTINEAVHDGQKIRTGEGESVLIKTSEGEVIRVTENSTVTIQSKKNSAQIKVNIGNLERFNSKDPSQNNNQIQNQKSIETLIQENLALKQKSKIQLKAQGEIVSLNTNQETLSIFDPEHRSRIVIHDPVTREVTLSWMGTRGNEFEIEVSHDGKPAKTYFAKSLRQKINLADNNTSSGFITWRVKDLTSNKATAWSQFQYFIGFSPIITQPTNLSNSYPAKESPNLFNVVLTSPFKNHQIEISALNKTHVVLTNQLITGIPKSLIAQNVESSKFQVSIRARSEIVKDKWTDWSDPTVTHVITSTELGLNHLNPNRTQLRCQKDQWECLEPVKFRLDPTNSRDVEFQSFWSLSDSETVYTTKTRYQSDLLTTCPPFPHTGWKLKIIQTHLQTQERLESKLLKISALASNPPQNTRGLAYALNDNQVVLDFPTCPHTQTKTVFEFSDGSLESTTSHSHSLITTLNRANPVQAQAQFLDVNQNSISAVSPKFLIQKITTTGTQLASKPPETPEVTNSKPEEPALAEAPAPIELPLQESDNLTQANEMTQQESSELLLEKNEPPPIVWTLKDAGVIYVAATESKAWSPISWKSIPTWPNYEYQVGSDINFTRIIDTKVLKTRSVKALIPDRSGTIFWRVRGVSENTFSEWSPTRKVEVKKIGKDSETRLSSEQ